MSEADHLQNRLFGPLILVGFAISVSGIDIQCAVSTFLVPFRIYDVESGNKNVKAALKLFQNRDANVNSAIKMAIPALINWPKIFDSVDGPTPKWARKNPSEPCSPNRREPPSLDKGVSPAYRRHVFYY